jgi:hypothetical protein
MTSQDQIAALPDASATLKSGIARLPGKTASLVLSALSAASWFMAPLNLLNFLTGLKSAAELWAKIGVWFAHLNLGPLLHGIETALNAVFGPWRAITAPVRAWAAQLLPAMPHFVADLFLMALISVPAFLRLAFNFISIRVNAARLAIGAVNMLDLGDEGDPRVAALSAEIHGPRRYPEIDRLTHEISQDWSDQARQASQDMIAEMQAGTFDEQSPAHQRRVHISRRAVIASNAALRGAQINLQRLHVKSALKLLRFTAILSAIGAAFVLLDYALRGF